MGRKKYINVPCEVIEEGRTEPCGKPSEVLKWRMCFAHYRRMQRYGSASEPARRIYTHDRESSKYPKVTGLEIVWEEAQERQCSLDECFDRHEGKGLCAFHYRIQYERTRTRRKVAAPRDRYEKNHQRRRDAHGYCTSSEMRDLLAAHGGRCLFCQVPLDEMTHSKNRDHVVPIARGGSNWIENNVPCCRSCNLSKGAKTLTEYRDYLARVRMLTNSSWSP